MVNSTDKGGGVAEMLPKLVHLLNELGKPARWVVIEPDRPGFVSLTKNLHNLIHGEGHPGLEESDRKIYESVNRSFVPALDAGEVGLLYRPIVTQISRWDRLKGFAPLLEGFVRLEQRALRRMGRDDDPRHRHQLEILRLVLAGPDPASIQDDPEGQKVVRELVAAYRALPPEDQEDVAILTLPMENRKENAVLVNALLRDPTGRDLLARSAQRRVHEEFLIFTQLRRWLRLLAHCC